jgi:hypothetical protein
MALTNAEKQARFQAKRKELAKQGEALQSFRSPLFLARGHVHQFAARDLPIGGWGILTVMIYTDPAIGLKPTTVLLPHIRDGIAGWVREVVFIDYDGGAAVAPVTIVAPPGESINGELETRIELAFGVARLLPVCTRSDDFPDRWFLG